jgi:hypothetical protein
MGYTQTPDEYLNLREKSQFWGLVLEFLESCNPRQAQAVRFRFEDELTYSEIARRLGVQPETARHYITSLPYRIWKAVYQGRIGNFDPQGLRELYYS